jgi:prepilin-type N-terminal cleavage/methylation domain-containing protein
MPKRHTRVIGLPHALIKAGHEPDNPQSFERIAKLFGFPRGESEMRKKKGFSLIELLIVVAIILIIAAIAVPSLLQARLAANDSAGASTMRTINTAEVTYSTTYASQGYASSLDILGGTPPTFTAAHAGMIDGVVGCPKAPCLKAGHNYYLLSASAAAPFASYTSTADPVSFGNSAKKVYCSTTDNVIRWDATPATKSLGAAIADDGTCLKAPYAAIQ